MEYGLFIRNQRTGKWVNLSSFAKVLHHWSGDPSTGMQLRVVPGMNTLVVTAVHQGSSFSATFTPNGEMHCKPLSDVGIGISNAERAWHAVTLITESPDLPEGVRDDLESVPTAGCILNYEDYCLYSSPPSTQRRTHMPVHVLAGVIYE